MNSVYNSPPNWPAPPAGWTPPPGWTPDPSWPDPPQNWQFQVPAPNPPPARKRRLWLKIGLPVAAVVLIIAGSIAAFVLKVLNTLEPVEKAASSYVQALKDERYEAAHAMHCPADLANPDAFVQEWRSQSSTGHGITSFKIVGVNVETSNGRTSGSASLVLHYADGTQKNQKLPLAKTGSTWKPCP